MATMPPEQPPQSPGQMPPAPTTGYGSGGYPAAPQQYGSGMPELAGWGSRVIGALVDGLIVAAFYVVALMLGMAMGSTDALGNRTPNFGIIAIGYLAAFGFAIWQAVQQGKTGQTIGKKVAKIRLLREQDGQPVGVGMSIARIFVHIIDGIPCYVGYLWPLWDAKRQTFTDKVLGTVVVVER